jgi:O-antigen ligase
LLIVNVAFLAMTLWLLRLANSAMASLCFIIGVGLILTIRSQWARSHQRQVRLLIPSALAAFVILEAGFGLTQFVIEALGRETTLTGRTPLWSYLLSADINPLLGAGYESFWLGDRLQQAWAVFPWRPNQAHNGYLEVYINLGIIGVSLVLALVLLSYRRITKAFIASYSNAALPFALWAIFVVYNLTEASVINGTLWFVFILGSVYVPGSVSVARWPVQSFARNQILMRDPQRN